MKREISERLKNPCIVFDFGGVVVDWNPRYLYRKIFKDETEVEAFLKEVDFHSWNLRADAGARFEDLFSEIRADLVPYARLFQTRFLETLSGPIEGSLAIVEGLKKRGHRLYGLTNWSRETFPLARKTFKVFDLFDDILVSGQEGLVKPDLEIYERFMNKFEVSARDIFFIDDKEVNIKAAESLGWKGHVFKDAPNLKLHLQSLHLL